MMRRHLTWIAVLSLLPFALPVGAAGVSCPARFQDTFTEAMHTDQQEQFFLIAQKVLGQSNDPEFNRLFRTFANEVLAALENPSVPGVTFDNTLVPMMRAVEGLFAGRYTLDEFKAAFRAADGFRRNGVLLPGISERVPTPTSSSWISTVFNRGHLFEMAGASYLTRAGGPGGGALVDAARIKGFGFRVDIGGSPLEGDLVELLTEGERWIDFKAANGNYTLEELARIEAALDQGVLKEFVVAHQEGTSAPAAWLAELQAANQRLAAGGFRPIGFVSAGTL